MNRTKLEVRAKVEPAFSVVQVDLWVGQSPLQESAKTALRLDISCGLANLYMVRRRQLAVARGCVQTKGGWPEGGSHSIRTPFRPQDTQLGTCIDPSRN
ncbi:MAG TPA: hypothetical protein DEA71_16645 [Nitrospira sp.]|nr:hypothetical protein [Nitrospira sp.]